MLENYEKTIDGVIHQIGGRPIDYDLPYIEQYVKYGNQMSYLRLGFIIGSLGRVPDSILDVGYGDGSFLKVAQNLIKNCYGNDVSPYPVPDGTVKVSDISENFYDVITFFDSLEHFTDIEFVKDLKCNAVCISLPHCHYNNDEWFENWKHRKPNEHFWHFNEVSLTNFMNRMGYSLVSCSNVEDAIRKGDRKETNILTCVFEKK